MKKQLLNASSNLKKKCSLVELFWKFYLACRLKFINEFQLVVKLLYPHKSFLVLICSWNFTLVQSLALGSVCNVYMKSNPGFESGCQVLAFEQKLCQSQNHEAQKFAEPNSNQTKLENLQSKKQIWNVKTSTGRKNPSTFIWTWPVVLKLPPPLPSPPKGHGLLCSACGAIWSFQTHLTT